MNERVSALRSQLHERKLDALLVSSATNRRYLSGFTGSAGVLLIGPDSACIFSDFRYRAQIAREAPNFTADEYDNSTTTLNDLIAKAATTYGFGRIGFEAGIVSVIEHTRLAARLHALADNAPSLVPVEGVVERLRAVKDAAEIATLRRAIALTDATLGAVLPHLHPTMSERQAAWLIEREMRERGAEAVAFTIIVAAGRNAALPHARPGDDPLGEGQPIVIDMGARVDGYHADMTRTIALGTPDERFRTIYAIVLEAQRRAITGIRPGMYAWEADALARDHITAAGYGETFGHGLGHGVGLDIHELPSVRRAVPGKEAEGPRLQAGSIFSLEPGIYLADWGGVRIEDLVLLHAHGCEVLSQTPKELGYS